MTRWAALIVGLVLAGCTTVNPAPKAAGPSTRTTLPSAIATAPSPSPTSPTCRVGAKLRSGAVVSVIGDSYTSRGQPDTWPALLARKNGLRAYVNALDSSGYMAKGLIGKNFDGPRFPDQVPKLVSQRPDLVIVMGSINDFGRTGPPYPAVVLDTLRRIRALAPLAPLLVVGSFWSGTHPPPAELYYIHDVLRRSAAAVPCASFLDPRAEGWFDHPAGLVGSDGEHPNAAGIARIAAFYDRDLRRLGYL